MKPSSVTERVDFGGGKRKRKFMTNPHLALDLLNPLSCKTGSDFLNGEATKFSTRCRQKVPTSLQRWFNHVDSDSQSRVITTQS